VCVCCVLLLSFSIFNQYTPPFFTPSNPHPISCCFSPTHHIIQVVVIVVYIPPFFYPPNYIHTGLLAAKKNAKKEYNALPFCINAFSYSQRTFENSSISISNVPCCCSTTTFSNIDPRRRKPASNYLLRRLFLRSLLRSCLLWLLSYCYSCCSSKRSAWWVSSFRSSWWWCRWDEHPARRTIESSLTPPRWEEDDFATVPSRFHRDDAMMIFVPWTICGRRKIRWARRVAPTTWIVPSTNVSSCYSRSRNIRRREVVDDVVRSTRPTR